MPALIYHQVRTGIGSLGHLHQGQKVLIIEDDGLISWLSERGPLFLRYRVVSSWSIYANGEPWEQLNGGAVSYHASFSPIVP